MPEKDYNSFQYSMIVDRTDVRQSIQSESFDALDFIKATRTMNLDKLTSLLGECKMESRCELSDHVTTQYEMFKMLYDDISMVGRDEIRTIGVQSKKLMALMSNYTQTLDNLLKHETEAANLAREKNQSLLDAHSVSAVNSLTKQIKSQLGTNYDSKKILLQISLLDRLNSSTSNGRAKTAYSDFKEEFKVKLEQLALSCLYDMHESKWRFVSEMFCGLGQAHELAELFYKAKIQPLVFKLLSKTSKSPFSAAIDSIIVELSKCSELEAVSSIFTLEDYHEQFVIGAIWRPIAESIMERSEIFSPTHQERFHSSYTGVQKLITYIETKVVKSEAGLNAFRAIPSVTKLRQEWQFNVYFQLLFRSNAEKLEQIIKDDNLAWQSVFECAMELIRSCWSEQVFLFPLLAKFTRFALQLEGRCRTSAIPKVLEQSTLVESNLLGEKIVEDMAKLNDYIRHQLDRIIGNDDENLKSQLFGTNFAL